jgi:ABC-2 type transport system permease protein
MDGLAARFSAAARAALVRTGAEHAGLLPAGVLLVVVCLRRVCALGVHRRRLYRRIGGIHRAIGLSIVGVWGGAIIGIIHAEPSSPLGFLLPALASLSQTPWVAAAMIFYFLAGYLTIGMIFLAVGAISDSMQEAQSYLMPLMLLIALPATGLANLIFRDPNGLVARIFSWIPSST